MNSNPADILLSTPIPAADKREPISFDPSSYKSSKTRIIEYTDAIKILDSAVSDKTKIVNDQKTDIDRMAERKVDIKEIVNPAENNKDKNYESFAPDPEYDQTEDKRNYKIRSSTSQSNCLEYLDKRISVEIELPDTLIRISAIDVLVGPYCITVLLPVARDTITFIPKPGTEVNLKYIDKRYECYFPGSYFEIPRLSFMGLVFIRKATDG